MEEMGSKMAVDILSNMLCAQMKSNIVVSTNWQPNVEEEALENLIHNH